MDDAFVNVRAVTAAAASHGGEHHRLGSELADKRGTTREEMSKARHLTNQVTAAMDGVYQAAMPDLLP
jgi:hypothetical protein